MNKLDYIEVLASLRNFEIDKSFNVDRIQIRPIISGLLHKTYLVTDSVSKRNLVIQNLKQIFDLSSLDSNLKLYDSIYKNIKNKNLIPDYWHQVKYLNVVGTLNKIYIDKDGKGWRMMEFVDGKIFNDVSILSAEEKLSLSYSFGEGLAVFGKILDSAPVSRWKDTLPEFHNLSYHLDYLDSVLSGKKVVLSLSNNKSLKFGLDAKILNDYSERVNKILKEIDRRRGVIGDLNELGFSVTHGDPKVNNAVFIKDNLGLWKCTTLIDLDTLQKGGVLDDIGDALRSIGGLGNEKPKDLNSVTVSKLIVDSVIQGYFNKYRYYYGTQKSDKLRKYVYKSYAKFLYMLSLRFLADFLIGDKYFLIYKHQRNDLNLFRAEVQMKSLELVERIYRI